MYKYILLFGLVLFLGCNSSEEKKTTEEVIASDWMHAYQAISKFGDTLYSEPPSKKIVALYKDKKKAFEEKSDLENTIWFGRFTAYTGNYREAIQIYTEGLEKFPNESRLLRHRGHRYITVREFDNAIADLEKAAALIRGKENKIEEDGMPNAQNTPVSTMHGNIYYHLGLAQYLNNNDQKALDAFTKCLQTSPNPDNLVSASHWLYTINCQMGQKSKGFEYVKDIPSDLKVIENEPYLKACLLYKGELQPTEIQVQPDGTATNSALLYGLGNYLLCEGDSKAAKQIFEDIVAGSDWDSFGYITAEVELATKFKKKPTIE
ncbi:tetratricopeptide repeat protein [Rasiella sp. SM2506]|uniref:tetratricopeptide repeat protein n=1 Tax=Rasiella sp. SM2506 TaxID=3423914 RepID=UPI003D7C0772